MRRNVILCLINWMTLRAVIPKYSIQQLSDNNTLPDSRQLSNQMLLKVLLKKAYTLVKYSI